MKTPKIADSLKAAASMLRVDVQTVRAAKDAGCPAFQNGRVDVPALKAWLAEVSRRKRAPAPAPATATEPIGTEIPIGLAASLQRLAQAEAEAFRGYQAALARNDVIGTPGARRGWLEVSEALRKADISLESARREAGELVPRETVEKALWLWGYFLNAAWMDCAYRAMARLQSMAVGLKAKEIQDVLTAELRWKNVGMAAAATSASNSKIPPWVVAATVDFWDKNLFSKKLTPEIEAMAAALQAEEEQPK